MKGKDQSRDARLRAGQARLAALGLSGGTACPVHDLERALESHPETALAVVSRLAEILSDDSVACLRRIEAAASEDRELRREVRRALYRLAQRGVPGAALLPSTPESPAPAIFAEVEPEGYLSFPDPFGDRLLWIVKPRGAGGLLQLSAVVNEPGGLKEAVLAELSRKQLRSLRADLAERHELRLVETSWRYCDWILSEGHERARSQGRLGDTVASFPQLRLQLFRTPAAPQPSPIETASEMVPDAASLQASADLFAEPELAQWFLPESTLAPYLGRVQEMRDSPIVLDRFQQMSRVGEIVNGALEALFSGDAGRSWQRKLEEMAHYFSKTGRPEAARRARATAQALSESPSGGRGIPFLEELVRRSFGLFFEREVEKEREEQASSLILTPDQLRQQRGSRPAPRLRPGSG